MGSRLTAISKIKHTMKQSFKIRTVLRADKSKENGMCPIYYIVILNGKEFKLSTGKWIEKCNWDAKNREPKNNSNLKRTLQKEAVALEDYFCEQTAKQVFVTIDMLKRFYQGEDTNIDFFEYYERFLQLKSKTVRVNTIKSYKGTLNHLRKFRKSITIGEIDLKFLHDFNYYLLVTVGLNKGGAWAIHKNLRTITNQMVPEGLLESSPYDGFNVESGDSKTIYLEEGEIEKIIELRKRLSGKMQTNVDRFLLSCYTGLRYSDMVSLKWSDIKADGTITKLMVKTDKIVVVPISGATQSILDRYKEVKNIEGLVFPRISNNKLNKALKTICKLAKIDKYITFHVARHTYGTILARKGVNAFAIMKLMGHSDIKQTNRYVHTSVDALSSVINGIDAFKKAS